MRILHINAGTETGGGKVHLISLLSQFSLDSVELLTFQNGMIATEAKNIGIKTTILHQKNQFDLSILKKLIKYINSGNFDIVHSHGPRANLFLNIIRRQIKPKWLITVHSDPRLDFISNGIKGKLFTALNLQSIRNADYIITVSNEIKEYLTSLGYSDNLIEVVHNGIEFNNSNSVLKEYNNQFIITHIGRFHPIKRHKYLIDSVIKSGISNYYINFIGDGELLNEIKHYTQKMNLGNNVKFHGYLNSTEINEILKLTDITLLTSKSETFPLVLLESASQKTPFITTDVGDVSNLDPNNAYSWTVPVERQQLLIKALQEAYEMWENKTLHIKGEDLYAFTSEEFTLKNMYENTLRVYSKIINQIKE